MKLAYHCSVHVASYSFFDSYDAELVGKRNRRPERHTVGKSCVSPSIPGTFKPPCVFRKSYSPGRILRKCLKEESTHMTYYFTIFCIRRGASMYTPKAQYCTNKFCDTRTRGAARDLPKSLVILLVARQRPPRPRLHSSKATQDVTYARWQGKRIWQSAHPRVWHIRYASQSVRSDSTFTD